ncbi:hypothetical protein P0L94_02355 [Microbacter sp. GSS18]|nr:hypothetical protein P0L94_02355 [Microbacter sp. GSS18]
MKRKLPAVAAALALAVTALIAPTSAALAADHEGGMCAGPSTMSMGVNAHANGAGTDVPKYILNVSTDEYGTESGALVLGQGGDRLQVTDWCRVWMHIPGESGPGEEGLAEGGATVAHAAGFTWQGDGTHVLVRTDVRETGNGMSFRVRYRAWPPGGDHESLEATMEEEEGWTKVPVEGWYPLTQLIVHAPVTAG